MVYILCNWYGLFKLPTVIIQGCYTGAKYTTHKRNGKIYIQNLHMLPPLSGKESTDFPLIQAEAHSSI